MTRFHCWRGAKWSGSRRDKARFLNIAQGSSEECRYYLLLANDSGFGEIHRHKELLEELSNILESYTQTNLQGKS